LRISKINLVDVNSKVEPMIRNIHKLPRFTYSEF